MNLLPCPMCGAEPLAQEHPAHTHVFATFMPDHPGSYTIECPACNLGMIDSDEAACSAAWNRRNAPPSAMATIFVPREPTEAMLDAAFAATVWPDLNRATSSDVMAGLRANMVKEYKAMLAAAPQATQEAFCWYRVENIRGDEMRVYYESNCWPDLIPLYTAPQRNTLPTEERRSAIRHACQQLQWIALQEPKADEFEARGEERIPCFLQLEYVRACAKAYRELSSQFMNNGEGSAK